MDQRPGDDNTHWRGLGPRNDAGGKGGRQSHNEREVSGLKDIAGTLAVFLSAGMILTFTVFMNAKVPPPRWIPEAEHPEIASPESTKPPQLTNDARTSMPQPRIYWRRGRTTGTL